ncbi:MAG: hypothetical protein CMO20_02675, partial [Thermoplasmata archaeon]|nr:hypothetical protein [Thermoplasmata archaeon]
IIEGYKAHVLVNIRKRDHLLTIANTSAENKEKWIEFFNKIDNFETNLQQSEKEKLIESCLREKYQIF